MRRSCHAPQLVSILALKLLLLPRIFSFHCPLALTALSPHPLRQCEHGLPCAFSQSPSSHRSPSLHALRSPTNSPCASLPELQRSIFELKDRRCFLKLALAVAASTLSVVAPAEECPKNSCISLDRRLVRRLNRDFVISQEFEKGGSRSTGVTVWEAGIVLSGYMESQLPPSFWKGKKVLELGAGIGLGSMVASLAGAQKVIITDGDEKALNISRRNIEENMTEKEIETAQIIWEKLRWEWAFDPNWRFNGEPPDIIIASDVTYYKENIPPLMQVLQRLAGPKTEIFLGHTIRGSEKEMQQFYQHFEVEKVSQGPAFIGYAGTYLLRMKYDPNKNAPVQFDPDYNEGCQPGYIRKKLMNVCVPGLRSLGYRDVDVTE